MDDDDRALIFDDVAVDQKERDPWRLGHRRPWWQWNVLTLFGALFLLVWVRELAQLPQTATWLTCVCILAIWALGPVLTLQPPKQSPPKTGQWAAGADQGGPTDIGRFIAMSMAVFLVLIVFVLAGGFIGMLAFLASMMAAAAARDNRV